VCHIYLILIFLSLAYLDNVNFLLRHSRPGILQAIVCPIIGRLFDRRETRNAYY